MHDSDEGVGTAQVEMPRYVSHKQVWALEIKEVLRAKEVTERTYLSFVEPGYADIPAAPEMFSRYQPVPGDFYVVYGDGYKSFSPRKAFLEGYVRELR